MAKISVLGSGSWGMSLALLLFSSGRQDRRMPENSGKKEKILTGFQVYRFRKTLKF